MIEILVVGFILGLTHAIPPGPITFEVLRRGMTRGLRPALQVDIGAVTADVVFFAVITLGLAQAMEDRTVKISLWLGGCVLLTILGLRGIYRLRSKRNMLEARGAAAKSETGPFLAGFLICLTSPFAILWWAGVFAGAMGASLPDGTWASLTVMFGGIAFACLLWYGTVGFIGATGKRLIGERGIRAMAMACSLLMIGFALILFYRGYSILL